jgi:hypothetical protein
MMLAYRLLRLVENYSETLATGLLEKTRTPIYSPPTARLCLSKFQEERYQLCEKTKWPQRLSAAGTATR